MTAIYSEQVEPELVNMIDSLFAQFRRDQVSPGEGLSFDEELWEALSELGLARLTGSEEYGGSDADVREAACLLTSAASAAVSAPLAENDLLAGWLLESVGMRPDDMIRTAARVDEPGTAVAPWGRFAERIVLVRRSSTGWELAEVTSEDMEMTPGINVAGEPRDTVTVPEDGPDWVSAPKTAGEELLLRGALARCIQTCGAMETIVNLCVDHTTQRVQFGRPLSRFQAVQHLVADLASEAALARAATDAAISRVSELGWLDTSAAFSVAVAKSCTGHAVSPVVRNAHQVHGAMGTTYEHDLHRYTKSALAWRAEFGSPRAWDEVLTQVGMQTEDVWPLITDGLDITHLLTNMA